MTSKKIDTGKRPWHFLLASLIISIIIFLVLYFLIESISNNFPLDNARYFYSAVFQGFVALLALTITIVLITFQNMNLQRYNTEERIYKILGRRFPTYIPGTIKEIKQDMEDCSLHHEFVEYIKENTKLSLEKHELHVKRITDELKSAFDYLDYWKKHKSNLDEFFVLSTSLSILVLFYNAIALLLVGSYDVPSASPFDILFGGLFLVMATIIFFALSFFEIIKTWKIQPNNS